VDGDSGNVATGMEGVVTGREHSACKVAHDGLCLEVEIPQHGVALPTAQQLDGVAIHVGVKKRHGATRSEGAGAHVGREIAKRGAVEDGGCPEGGSDVRGRDSATTGTHKISGENGVGGGGVIPEVLDSPDHGGDGAEEVMAAAAMGDDLAPDTILLSSEGE